jgi:hypothetical protein
MKHVLIFRKSIKPLQALTKEDLTYIMLISREIINSGASSLPIKNSYLYAK